MREQGLPGNSVARLRPRRWRWFRSCFLWVYAVRRLLWCKHLNSSICVTVDNAIVATTVLQFLTYRCRYIEYYEGYQPRRNYVVIAVLKIGSGTVVGAATTHDALCSHIGVGIE